MNLIPGKRIRDTGPTVFHITHYKAGSQWVYAFLQRVAPDRVVKPLSGARHVTGAPPGRGMIYPTVYLRRDELDAVPVVGEQRRFVVIRDLRDSMVSMYFSHRYSHGVENPEVRMIRSKLEQLDERDGLLWTLEHSLHVNVDIQRSWLGQAHPVIRYEDLVADQHAGFDRVAAACGLDVPKRQLREHVNALSFERLSGRCAGTEDRNSHLRKGIVGDWRNYFDDEMKFRFKQLYGDVLADAGYATDDDW